MFPSLSLNNSEKQIVSSALPPTSQVHHGAICRLYKTNNENAWEKRLFGTALILTNTDTGSHFIELVDMKTKQICFTQQLYNNFTYQKSTNYFHTFETDDGVIGLSFSNEAEADRFYQRVHHCANPRRVPPRPPRPFPPTTTEPRTSASPVSARGPPPPIPTVRPPIQPAGIRTVTATVPESLSPRTASPQPRTPQARASMPVISFSHPELDIPAAGQPKKSESKKVSRRSSFIRGMRSSLRDLVSPSKSKEMVISGPTDFKHVARIGFNPEQGTFEISNIPPEWKHFFAEVGIKKSDLKNKETATMVMNIIENHKASAPPPIPPQTETVQSAPARKAPPMPPRPEVKAPQKPTMAPPPVPNTNSDCAPPPPPLPPVINTETVKSPAAQSPSARAGPIRPPPRGADFESQLSSAKLKHVELNSSFKSAPSGDLASTLMRAMEERRVAIREDVIDDDSDDDWDL